jgi:thymidylate kinase
MTFNNKIIAIEGVDGVGKSSLCEVLSKSFRSKNIKVAKTPYGDFLDLALMAKKEGKAGSFCGYLIGDIAIRNQFQNYDYVFLDRYILSTLVYHNSVVASLKESIFSLLELTTLVKPTITILLEANPSLISNRITQRNELTKNARSVVELQNQFDIYINDPRMQPWLGKLIRIRSEKIEDQEQAIKIISEIVFN